MVRSERNSKIHNAIYDNDFELVKKLISKYPKYVHSRKHWLKEPVIKVACNIGDYKIVKLLIEKGADVNSIGHMEATPLHDACNSGNTELVRLLINNGANINAKRMINRNENCLFFASNEEIVDLLVEKGLDIYSRDWSNRVPLHWASQFGKLSVVKALINHGCDLNVRDEENRTPLHWALNHQTAKLLLDLGAEIDPICKRGETPLNSFSSGYCNDRLKMIKVFFSYGADLFIKNNNGESTYYNLLQINEEKPKAFIKQWLIKNNLEPFPKIELNESYKVEHDFIRLNNSKPNDVICVGEEGIITKWELENERYIPIQIIDSQYPEIYELEVSPNGKFFVLSNRNNIEVRNYDTFEVLDKIITSKKSRKGLFLGKKLFFKNFSFSEDGNLIIFENRDGIFIYDFKDDKFTEVLEKYYLSFSGSYWPTSLILKEKFLIVGSLQRYNDGEIFLFKMDKLKRFKLINKIILSKRAPENIVFSVKHRLIITTTINVFSYDYSEDYLPEIHIYNFKGQLLKKIECDSFYSIDVKNIICFSEDENLLFWVEHNKEGKYLFNYNFSKDKITKNILHIKQKICSIIIKNNYLIAAGEKGGIIRINLNQFNL